jgi:DNA-binding MarR family transcriptional regulator
MLHSELSIIVRGGDIFMARCLANFGITASEVVILMYLYGHDNPRQEDIAECLMLDKGTIARTLQRLERKEIIERTINESDQREKVITVTEKGYTVRGVCTDLVRIWHELMFSGISEEEMEAFALVTEKIARNVSADLEKWGDIYG